MKIAVVHDYFTQLGGAEKVAEELMRVFPTATLHSTVALPNRMPAGLTTIPITTTWMQRLPMMERYYRFYFLLYPFAVSALNLWQYDLVITSSSGYVKGVRTHPGAIHVCYCHTPMRWAWSFENYSSLSMNPAQRFLLRFILGPLQNWDLGASRQPDHFIANSKTVADRIQRAYGRTAEVIHPPIDLNRFSPSAEQGDYFLILSRLVSYKRIDVAVEACTRLGRRLLVIGHGPDRYRLQSKAGPTVSFLGRLSDAEVEHYASRCQALIFPGEEDFGMAPLELAAAGRPTLAYRAGGAVETVVDGVTGILFDRQDPDALCAAIQAFDKQEWSPELLRKHAEKFSVEVFHERFHGFLDRIDCPAPKPSSHVHPKEVPLTMPDGNRQMRKQISA